MTPAYVFAALSAVVFLLFCYLTDLAFFYRRLQKEFLSLGGEKDWLRNLEEEHKRKKHFQKKNLLLFFIVKTLVQQGEKEKAEKLSAFLKSDFLLGIKKRSDR